LGGGCTFFFFLFFFFPFPPPCGLAPQMDREFNVNQRSLFSPSSPPNRTGLDQSRKGNGVYRTAGRAVPCLFPSPPFFPPLFPLFPPFFVLREIIVKDNIVFTGTLVTLPFFFPPPFFLFFFFFSFFLTSAVTVKSYIHVGRSHGRRVRFRHGPLNPPPPFFSLFFSPFLHVPRWQGSRRAKRRLPNWFAKHKPRLISFFFFFPPPFSFPPFLSPELGNGLRKKGVQTEDLNLSSPPPLFFSFFAKMRYRWTVG